jgi:hypothetical protein
MMVDFSTANWRKSSRSGSNGCVEVALVDDHVGIRDSKDPLGPVLVFAIREWQAFAAGMKDGEFEIA